MKKWFSFSRIGLFVVTVIFVFSVMFMNIQGQNTSTVFAQNLLTDTPTPLSLVTLTETAAESTATPDHNVAFGTPTLEQEELTATPTPQILPTDTPEPTITFENSKVQISSEVLNVTFLAPENWSSQIDIELEVPGYEPKTGIVLILPEQQEEIVLLSLPKEVDIPLEDWIILQEFRFPQDIQFHTLDSQIFSYPSSVGFGRTAEGESKAYVLIDRGESLLEISYRSQEALNPLDEFWKLVESLNPADFLELKQNPIPDLTSLRESDLAMETNKDALVSPVILERILPVLYVDQVYIEYKKLQRFDGIWNWCGPSSTAVVLSYLGIEKRDVTTNADATWEIANNVLESQAYNAPMMWGKLTNYLKTRGIMNTYHSTAEAFPSYDVIKSNINAGKPIIAGIQMYWNGTWNGHIIAIVGYRDPNYVIVQDSAGSRMWAQTNWGDRIYTTANLYGNKVAYTWSELNARYKSGWMTFTFPRITSLSPLSKPAGSAAFTLTVNGAGFVPSSKIQWNGLVLSTTYVSDKQLKASITADKIASGSIAKVTVFNYSGLNGTSNSSDFTVNNPVPTTTGLSHRVISQTGPDLTITVTGTGFVKSSKVKLNSQFLSTTYVSSTQLRAVIPSGLRTGVGKVTMSVFNSAPAGGTSNGQILVKVDFNAHKSILSKHSNKAIDLASGSTLDGAKIQQYAWSSGNSNQWWFMIPTGGLNEYWIISWKSLKCLDVSSTADGTALTQRTCNFGSTQRFIRVAQGSYYLFKSTWSGDALDVRDWSTSDGAVIQLWTSTFGNNQLWYLK